MGENRVCVVCKGKIIDLGIGTIDNHYACEDCGIVYDKLPKKFEG